MIINSDKNSNTNSDQGNTIVNRYVFNRDLNEIVE